MFQPNGSKGNLGTLSKSSKDHLDEIEADNLDTPIATTINNVQKIGLPIVTVTFMMIFSIVMVFQM